MTKCGSPHHKLNPRTKISCSHLKLFAKLTRICSKWFNISRSYIVPISTFIWTSWLQTEGSSAGWISCYIRIQTIDLTWVLYIFLDLSSDLSVLFFSQWLVICPYEYLYLYHDPQSVQPTYFKLTNFLMIPTPTTKNINTFSLILSI